MNGTLRGAAAGALMAVLILATGAATAQGLWYKDVEKDGRKVNGISARSYNEFLLAAQAAF